MKFPVLRLSFALALTAALLGATSPQPAQALTIVVDTTAEAPGINGDCTLGEAVDAANFNAMVDGCAAGSSSDTITLQAGATYTLTSGTPTGYGPSAMIISTTITIEGNGATLEHDPPGDALRFFIMAPTGNLTLRNLTLRHGRAQGADGADGINLGDPGDAGGLGHGGAIYNLDGALILDGAHFEENVAQGGAGGAGFTFNPTTGSDGGDGGLAGGGAIYSTGSLIVEGEGARFTANEARGGAGGAHGNPQARGGEGGDAFAGAVVGTTAGFWISATVTATGNGALGGDGPGGGGNGSGGALALFDLGMGQIRVDGAVLEDNRAEGGDVTPHASSEVVVGGNAFGGAVYSEGGFTLADARVEGSQALAGDGPSGGYSIGGGIYFKPYLGNNLAGLLRVSVVENTAQGGQGSAVGGLPGGAGAGGVNVLGMPARVAASAVVSNAVVPGTNPATSTLALSLGGGLVFDESRAMITNTTIAFNSALQGGGIYNANLNVAQAITLTHVTVYSNTAPDGGGGLMAEKDIWLRNSIVADNLGGNCAGTIQLQGDNLQDPGSGCGVATQTNPLLGALGEHGGGTLTIDLLGTSPAINLADPDYCPSGDQRGVPRPLGGGCDLGAFERWGQLFLPLVLK